MSNVSCIRQHYSKECEDAINAQIEMELAANCTHMSMACHFDSGDIALKGFHEYFIKKSGEEREHAEMFMKYQNLRGGSVVLHDVKAPAFQWTSHMQAIEHSLQLEKNVYESLLGISKLADEKNDPHLASYLNSSFVKEQADSINEMGKILTNAKRCGNGLGLYILDKEMR